MPSARLPDSLFELLTLAGVIIFTITAVSAVLSALLIRKENLLYLATQLVLVFLFLHWAARWAYPLWFTGAFGDRGQYDRAMLTFFFFALAFTVDVATRTLLWQGMLAKSGRSAVPPLLVGTVRVLTYLFALLIVIQFVYGQSITALATLSGAFALILGLSAQTTLGEMFAGIAIALSRPFRLGDWVKVGALEEGRVVDMTWRLVRIETRDRHTISIPNRVVADSSVFNFSHPQQTVRVTETISLPAAPGGADTAAVERQLVEMVVQCPGVLAAPPPLAQFRGNRSGLTDYRLSYFTADYRHRDEIKEAVRRRMTEAVAAPFVEDPRDGP
jgi:small-conductance mechanosensitive channel